MIAARQSEQLVPALDRVDELLIRSTLGSRPTDIYYSMGPLQEASEKDAALMEYQLAQTIKEYADTGLLPDGALSAIAKNRIIESGRWPGSEAAFEEFADEPLPNDDPANDPNQLLTLEQRTAALLPSPPVKDAAPELPPIHVTVPVEVHMPKGGGTRTVVTKHTKDGRIAAFEQHPIEEE